MMKASMVVMSHLSDAQEMIGFVCGDSAVESINFAKYVISVTNGDLTQEIDEQEMYQSFLKVFSKTKVSQDMDINKEC